MARIKNILDDYEVILSTNNITYLHNTLDSHEPVYAVNSNKANTIIRQHFYQHGVTLRNSDLKEVNELLTADAVMKDNPRKVHFYVAGVDEGDENEEGPGNQGRSCMIIRFCQTNGTLILQIPNSKSFQTLHRRRWLPSCRG